MTVVLFVGVWVTLAATGDVSALSPTVSLQHGVAMESSSSPPHSSQKRPEEAARKRELRMKKNR